MRNRKRVEVTANTDTDVVTVTDLKRHIRGVPGTADDQIIEDFLDSATEYLKEYLRIGLKTETFKLTMDTFGEESEFRKWQALGGGVHTGSIVDLRGGWGYVDLPFAPVQSVTSVTTFDRDDTSSVFPAANYGLDERSGRLYLNEGEVWPTNLRDYEAVSIVYVAGYGASSVPEPIKAAIRELVRLSYDGCAMQMSDGTKAMLSPYKRLDALEW